MTSDQHHPTDEISPSTRIRELNQIDVAIASLLNSASTATSILANQQPNPSLTSAQAAFTAAAETYFSTLSSIEVRLRRQVYALEEAGLVSAGDERDTRRGRALNHNDDGGGGGARRAVAGGPLDPSWLNARASTAVEAGMKKEVLGQARKLVEESTTITRTGAVGSEMDQGD